MELDRTEMSRLMLPMLCERLGADPSDVLHAAAHRWRYAHVKRPFDELFLRDHAGTIFAGGDWCGDAMVETAWSSGNAIAEAVLELEGAEPQSLFQGG